MYVVYHGRFSAPGAGLPARGGGDCM